jgi:hypothetical protein
MERAKIELGIIIARLRRLLVAAGHCPVGCRVGKRRVGGDQHSQAAGNDDKRSLGLGNRVTKCWPR